MNVLFRMKTLRLTFLCATGICVAGACTTLGGKPPLVSDRPDFTESTQLIAPGHVQVESGITQSSEDDVRTVSVGEVFTRIGLADRLELRVVPNSYSVVSFDAGPTLRGREDPTLGVKIGLLDPTEMPSWRPALSLIAGTSIPLGSARFRAPHLQPEAKLLASWTINDRVSFASNVNYARPVFADRGVDEYSASASFGFVLTERVGVYTEAFGFSLQNGSNTRKFANVGSTLLLSPDLQLDARVGVGPSTKAGDYFFGVGVVRRW